MEETKRKRHHIFLKAVFSALIFTVFGFYAYSFPKTMELLDKKMNEIISFSGIDYEISAFSDFSVFAEKTLNIMLYYYEIIINNIRNDYSYKKPLFAVIFSCAAEFPVENGNITSFFGEREDPFSGKADSHTGMDISTAFGSEVYAAWPGVVSESGFDKIYGKYVVIEHSKGLFSKYCHLSKITVSEGDAVKAKDKVGEAGSTGRSTGSHLHFEVEVNGRKIDPMECFEF